MVLFSANTIEKPEDKVFIEELYIKYIACLRFRESKIIGNDSEACADVAHDCMVNMIKHIDMLKTLSENKQRAYLAAAIDNTALNYSMKSSKVEITHKTESAELDFIIDSNDMESEVEKKMELEAVREKFDLLPDRDKDLIVLKYELEMSDEQIGEIFDIKKDSVRMTVRRSIQKLAKMINKGAKQ